MSSQNEPINFHFRVFDPPLLMVGPRCPANEARALPHALPCAESCGKRSCSQQAGRLFLVQSTRARSLALPTTTAKHGNIGNLDSCCDKCWNNQGDRFRSCSLTFLKETRRSEKAWGPTWSATSPKRSEMPTRTAVPSNASLPVDADRGHTLRHSSENYFGRKYLY